MGNIYKIKDSQKIRNKTGRKEKTRKAIMDMPYKDKLKYFDYQDGVFAKEILDFTEPEHQTSNHRNKFTYNGKRRK